MEETTTNFVDGVFSSRRENAPDFLVVSNSAKADIFIEYIKQHTNAKGYFNWDTKRSNKTGNLYNTLNDWQPSNQSNSQESQQEEIQVENIPF